MGIVAEAKRIIRKRFISGLLVVVPLIMTFVLLRWLVEFIDGLLRPLIVDLFGTNYDFPLVGFIVTFMLILLMGIIASSYVGRKLVSLWDKQLSRIPIINFVYGAAKQLMQALAIPQNKSFKSVVMVEYPRRGVYALGFLANEINMSSNGEDRKFLSVFIATTPTPFSGFIVLFPEYEVMYLDMTIEQGIKFFVSGSIITPDCLTPKVPKHILDKYNIKTDSLEKVDSVNEPE